MGRMNKYGLSRDIPESTKREIRKRCGFSCVKCGFAYFQYHHFDPPFEVAKSHDPSGITLLCGRCHDLEKGGLLSQSRIVRNEWQGVQTNWDIQINGTKIIIRHAFRSIDLEISLDSPNRLIIERMNMVFKGWRIASMNDGLSVYYPDGSIWFTARNELFCDNSHGIVFGD